MTDDYSDSSSHSHRKNQDEEAVVFTENSLDGLYFCGKKKRVTSAESKKSNESN